MPLLNVFVNTVDTGKKRLRVQLGFKKASEQPSEEGGRRSAPSEIDLKVSCVYPIPHSGKAKDKLYRRRRR